MTLREDLDELSLLVPDAPTLTVEVLAAGREYAQAAAGLVMDAATWQGEAAALLERLDSELALLTEDAKAMQELVESSVAAASDAFAEALAALAEQRVTLANMEKEAAEAVQTLGGHAAAAAEFVESACEEAATAAAQENENFEEQRQALEDAMLEATDLLPELDSAAGAASMSAERSWATIVGQLERLGPLATGHLTDGDDAVQGHMGDLCDAMGMVMETYRAGADAMAEALVETLDEKAPEVAQAADAADAAAWTASEAIAQDANRLVQEAEAFTAGQDELRRERDGLMPYVEEAYRAEERLSGAS